MVWVRITNKLWRSFTWILRCPTKYDAAELSKLRLKIDGETEFLVNGKIVGFTRCEGSKLVRFKHKAEFGICILKEYWGYGIGKVLLENVLLWADAEKIYKITLTVVQINTNAIMLYKRYGFVEEGLLINDRVHKDGKYYNTIVMGRFKS